MELMGAEEFEKTNTLIHYHPLFLMGVNRIKMDLIGVPTPLESLEISKIRKFELVDPLTC